MKKKREPISIRKGTKTEEELHRDFEELMRDPKAQKWTMTYDPKDSLIK